MKSSSLTTKTKLSLQSQQKSMRKGWPRLVAQAKAYDARQLAWQRRVDARLDALEKKAKKKPR